MINFFEHQEGRSEMVTLDKLPDIQRKIIILRFYNELKLWEIAVEFAYQTFNKAPEFPGLLVL